MISKKYNEQMGNYLAKLVQAQTNMCVAEKPISNADGIRASSDEELAEWIFNTLWSYDAICEKRKKDWLEWLKEEAVDNGACSADETSEKVQNE